MPAEGSTLTSGALLTERRRGDWRCACKHLKRSGLSRGSSISRRRRNRTSASTCFLRRSACSLEFPIGKVENGRKNSVLLKLCGPRRTLDNQPVITWSTRRSTIRNPSFANSRSYKAVLRTQTRARSGIAKQHQLEPKAVRLLKTSAFGLMTVSQKLGGRRIRFRISSDITTRYKFFLKGRTLNGGEIMYRRGGVKLSHGDKQGVIRTGAGVAIGSA